jgi:hypothetical protein
MMMRKLKLRRPSAGVVLGMLALIVAVAGNSGAFAGTKVIVRKGQIAKGAVTAKSLAQGAVHPAAISKGAVGVAALRPGSVGSGTLAPDAVIVDADADPHTGEWTASLPAVAMCAAGERILSGGIVFTETSDNQVGIVTSQAFANGGQNGWAGRITTDAGGLAKAEAQALCLK